jgi:transaldolase
VEGVVSIQGNPFADKDPQHIVDEALRYRGLGKNFIAKIPITETRIEAMEALIPQDVPLIATEGMSVAQAIAVCEMYQRVSRQCKKNPPFIPYPYYRDFR